MTYQRDLRALVEDNCLSCHVEGGIAPFALDSYERLSEYAPSVVAAVESGRMPPWLPDPDCRRFRDERILTAEEIGLFRRWMENGSPNGDPADYVPTAGQSLSPEALGTPTVTLEIPEPYVPNDDRPDDYHCFVMDQEFTEETYLRTSNVVPDQKNLVHHVILFLVPPQYVAQVEQLDQQESGPGYTCFGGVGAGAPQPIAGWVPGSPISPGSEDAAIRIPPGSKLVMQMHYNTLAGATAPDRSSVQLWFLDQRPAYLLQARFFPNLGIDIAPGDASSHQTRVYTNNSGEPWTIVSTSPHMHLLGTRLKTTKVAADGSEECMVDIPRWDFDWQQGYAFLDGDEVVVQPGESLRLECWYDNSAANQPVVNGVQLEPAHVAWGEGTLDEMCLNTLVFVTPYFDLPEVGEACSEFQPCYDQCSGSGFPQTACILQCSAEDRPCAECVLSGVIGCTADTCGAEASAMLQCFDDCAGQGQTCIPDRCTNQILGFDACVSPKVDAGECDASVSACNVGL